MVNIKKGNFLIKKILKKEIINNYQIYTIFLKKPTLIK